MHNNNTDMYEKFGYKLVLTEKKDCNSAFETRIDSCFLWICNKTNGRRFQFLISIQVSIELGFAQVGFNRRRVTETKRVINSFSVRAFDSLECNYTRLINRRNDLLLRYTFRISELIRCIRIISITQMSNIIHILL